MFINKSDAEVTVQLLAVDELTYDLTFREMASRLGCEDFAISEIRDGHQFSTSIWPSSELRTAILHRLNEPTLSWVMHDRGASAGKQFCALGKSSPSDWIMAIQDLSAGTKWSLHGVQCGIREGYIVFATKDAGLASLISKPYASVGSSGISHGRSLQRPRRQPCFKTLGISNGNGWVWDALVLSNEIVGKNYSTSERDWTPVWKQLMQCGALTAVAPSNANDYVDQFCEDVGVEEPFGGLGGGKAFPRAFLPTYVALSLFTVESELQFSFLRWCGVVWQDCVAYAFPKLCNDHDVMEFVRSVNGQECWYDIREPSELPWFLTIGKISDSAFIGSKDSALLDFIYRACHRDLVKAAC